MNAPAFVIIGITEVCAGRWVWVACAVRSLGAVRMVDPMQYRASRYEREAVATVDLGSDTGLGRGVSGNAAHGGSVAALTPTEQRGRVPTDGAEEGRSFGSALVRPIRVLFTTLVLSLMGVEFIKLVF